MQKKTRRLRAAIDLKLRADPARGSWMATGRLTTRRSQHTATLLPNGKVPARSVLPAAVAMGLIWELAKYAYILALPWLKFPEVYGPFYISITLMFWAFISGLLILAGAHLAAGPVSVEETLVATSPNAPLAQPGSERPL